jgi:nucleoside-diphosphate-sugar epimerase
MILVTGGTGLVGAHILFDLCSKNLQVRAIKRANSSLYLIESLFSFYAPETFLKLLDNIDWVEADLREIDSLIEATTNIDIVYHAAAIVSFSNKDAKQMLKANIEGTANLMNACKINNVKKIGHISSVAALGPSIDAAPLNELNQWEVSTNNSAYAISKYGAEREVWRISHEGMDVVIINPSLITGPGDWTKSSTAIFKTVFEGLKFYSLGRTGFVDVRDVSKTIIYLVESNITSERYIISSENLSWKQILTMIAQAFNKKPPHLKATSRTAAIAWRILKLVGWISGKEPKITKESVRSSQRERYFSNEKILDAMDIEFIPVKRSIQDTTYFISKFYL